jgi:[ribosomal protein S18]-alanine N-acetyltransferase
LLEVRPGGPGDLEQVEAIQAVSPEAAQWTVADYLGYDFRVATADGRVAGFLVGRGVGSGESEILNLAVQPEWRRKGVASTLVSGWVRDHPGIVYLEVRESNSAALELYYRFQFQIVTSRSGYYESPREGAIVLKFYSC